MKNQVFIEKAARIVIKIGSALVADSETGTVKTDWLKYLAEDIASLKEKDIIIVSSGAIALGRKTLGIDLKTPSKSLKIEKKQAAASIGQIKLIEAFIDAFQTQNLTLSQILLNSNDTEHRRTHLNARATLNTLLQHKIIPVINENDTTATDEIRFGDNDKLAARVAQMMEADLLLILSTTEGLYTDNPQINPNAHHIPIIENITEDVLSIAGDALYGVSTGGMKSKVESAKIAVNAGCNVIITSGRDLNPITKLLENQQKSTLFVASDTPRSARQKWIAAHLKPKGVVTIDDGAYQALLNGKSLLPIGVRSVTGTFERGDVLAIQDLRKKQLGTGLSVYDCIDAKKIIGKHGDEIADILGYAGRDVLIHRNDLVLSKEERP